MVHLDIFKLKSGLILEQDIVLLLVALKICRLVHLSTFLLRPVRFRNPYLSGSFKKFVITLFDRLIFFAISRYEQFFLCKSKIDFLSLSESCIARGIVDSNV